MSRRLLSNGRYSALLSSKGAGYSKWNGLLLSAWSGDRTEDGDGQFMYVRDLDSGRFWSVGGPVPGASASTSAYTPGRQRLVRRVDDIETTLDAWVTVEDDVEVRAVKMHNHSAQRRRIELTTYAEIVLNYGPAHAAHPAFSKLFVQTEYDAAGKILLARRRPRSSTEHYPWIVNGLVGDGPLQFETDRARFLGRNRTLAAPKALVSTAPMSGTVGNVLNPIFSLRRTVGLEPGAAVELAVVLGAAETREAACALAARYGDRTQWPASHAQAEAHERGLLSGLGLSEPEGERLQEIVGAMLYGDGGLRAPADVIARAHGSLSQLYQYGARLDWLLAVAHIEDVVAQRELAAQLVTAQAYWSAKGVPVQVWLLAGEPASLADELRAKFVKPEQSEVIVLRRSALPTEHIDLIDTAAHLIAHGSWPTVSPPAATAPSQVVPRPANVRAAPEPEPLVHFNGIGGFTPQGNEYVIRLNPTATDGVAPPTPWINVVSNERFGLLVSESGAGNTWSRNSRENRLTPWLNDPIGDPYGEALYLRDDDAGAFWSPQPGPAPAEGAYEVRHGFGYSRWLHVSHELEQEVLQLVPVHDPVKIVRLRLTNSGSRPRRLSIFSYHRLVLGVVPEDSGRFVVSSFDRTANALLARNRLNNEFSDGIVFAAAAPPLPSTPTSGDQSYTADRASFLGADGRPEAPTAVVNPGVLDGRTGSALDPCLALQLRLSIDAGATTECAFLLGETTDEAGARTLIERYRRPGAIDAALTAVRDFWSAIVSAVQVQTPSPAIDLMLNGWLLYQVLSCRLWGRSAFYQSGGALGFRDQLQDAAALIHARPDLTRAQILLHAEHQFPEGDVLHWWHPPTNRGIRTRFADDLLWLPYITAFYIGRTGDWGILDEQVGFVTTRPLAPGEDEAYLYPGTADERTDVYQHCCRAIDRSLTRGAHGLPLMGTGDWNDGMNRVGREGRGESVWLGFFLSCIIDDFVPLCERRGDGARAQRYRAYQNDLKEALETAGWDGRWYRRAYYDDESPFGTAGDQECRIDAIAQAWAVISRVASPEHATQALASVEELLISQDAGLIRLLTPPFDKEPRDPGYIKGYLPGIRENGGQYTHGAMWVVQAFAELGRRDRAARLLDMLSPVNHARTPERVQTYQVEPYVIVADIYSVAPHVGRGGWTWYTGSAGWMYRIGLESVLGLYVVDGTTMRIKPCIPDDWPEIRIRYRRPDGKTHYDIVVMNPARSAAAVRSMTIDGQPGPVEDGAGIVAIESDARTHRIEVTLG